MTSTGFSQNELPAGVKAPTIQYQKSYPANYRIPQKKPIFLDFWATWCGPCVAGLIENNELVTKYKDKVEFIAITDSTSKKVAEFITSRNFKFNFIIDNDAETFTRFGITGIPHAFLIDTAGTIQWSGYSRDFNEVLLKDFLLTGRVKEIKGLSWRYAYNDTSIANEVLRLVVVDKSLLETHKTILKEKVENELGQYSNSPKAEGKLTVINYSLIELTKRINPFFSTKILQTDEIGSQGYDFISLPFASFDILNLHLKKHYGICFQ